MYWNTIAKTSRTRRESLSGFISYYVSERGYAYRFETRIDHVGKEGQEDPHGHRDDGRYGECAIEIHHGKEESEYIVPTRRRGFEKNSLHGTQDVLLLLVIDSTDADSLQNVGNDQTERNVQIAHDLCDESHFRLTHGHEADGRRKGVHDSERGWR